ncbi:MAG: toll/interleukin-1 receptor domain-containing protein [Planctomycetes bacterium]|nr:toll/interleukin-1 receptor domain-containing protein [Planctomycetota bacterium]
MKVFIGWSGERSRALAQALHDWIPLVLHNVEPWVSEVDIEAGERWGEVVAKELADSNFGIICVTRENVASPWVLFEAGALAKTMQGSKVIPLLLDLEIRDITGPLAQFQAKKVERKGLNEVIDSMNQAANNEVPEARARELFDALWPKLEKEVKGIPKQPQTEKHVRPQHEILEELVVSVRSLDSRLRELSDGGPMLPRRRRMRIRPMMCMDMMRMLRRGSHDPIRLVMLASVFREEMPWLYELAMEAYRATKAGLPEEALRARRDFRGALESCMYGPAVEEMGLDPEIHGMLLHELERWAPTEEPPEQESKERPKRKKVEKQSP